MKNTFLKNNLKKICLCFLVLFMLNKNTIAQNTILGFKTADKQNKIETTNPRFVKPKIDTDPNVSNLEGSPSL